MSELIRRIFPYDGEPYGWMLTFDHFDNKPNSVAGPNAMSEEILERLKAGEGKEFRMLDDDKNLMASGRTMRRSFGHWTTLAWQTGDAR